jgi:hypothetical protein
MSPLTICQIYPQSHEKKARLANTEPDQQKQGQEVQPHGNLQSQIVP